jgi:PAS domain-containing protein
VAISRDITEQSQAEETLRASETKYRIVADYTYDWEYRRTPDGRFAYVSPSCERMTGYAASEFQADPDLLFRIVHPDDKMLVPCNMIYFVFRESMIFWRQLNEGGRHVAKISSNTDQGGAQRA